MCVCVWFVQLLFQNYKGWPIRGLHSDGLTNHRAIFSMVWPIRGLHSDGLTNHRAIFSMVWPIRGLHSDGLTNHRAIFSLVWSIIGLYLAWFDQSEGCIQTRVWPIIGLYLAYLTNQRAIFSMHSAKFHLSYIQCVMFQFKGGIFVHLLQYRKLYSLQSGFTYRFKGHPAELWLDESPGIERVWVGGEKLHHLRVETEVLAKCWELLPEAGGRRRKKKREERKGEDIEWETEAKGEKNRTWYANMSFVLVRNLAVCDFYCRVWSKTVHYVEFWDST